MYKKLKTCNIVSCIEYRYAIRITVKAFIKTLYTHLILLKADHFLYEKFVDNTMFIHDNCCILSYRPYYK